MGEIMSVRGRMSKRKNNNPQRHIALELREPPLVRPESPEEVGARMDIEARNMQEQKEQGRQQQYKRTRSQAVERARVVFDQYNEELERRAERARASAARMFEAAREVLAQGPPLVRPESPEEVEIRMNEAMVTRAEAMVTRAEAMFEAARQALEYGEESMRRLGAAEARGREVERRWAIAMNRSEPSVPPPLESVPTVTVEPSAEAQIVWQAGDQPARRGRIDGVQRPVAWTGEESGTVAGPVADQAEEPSGVGGQPREEKGASTDGLVAGQMDGRRG